MVHMFGERARMSNELVHMSNELVCMSGALAYMTKAGKLVCMVHRSAHSDGDLILFHRPLHVICELDTSHVCICDVCRIGMGGYHTEVHSGTSQTLMSKAL